MCIGSNGPQAAARNDNHRILSCWPLATPSGVRPSPQINAAKRLLLTRSARLALLRPQLILPGGGPHRILTVSLAGLTPSLLASTRSHDT